MMKRVLNINQQSMLLERKMSTLDRTTGVCQQSYSRQHVSIDKFVTWVGKEGEQRSFCMSV